MKESTRRCIKGCVMLDVGIIILVFIITIAVLIIQHLTFITALGLLIPLMMAAVVSVVLTCFLSCGIDAITGVST